MIFKKVTSQILFGKGKVEGSWLGPWALSAAGCFVCWAEVLTGARVEAGEGPAASPTQGEGFFLCLTTGNEAKHQKCRLSGLSQAPSQNLHVAQGPRELVCMLQLEKHCFRDDSQGLHFAGRGILRPRGEEGFARDRTASAGNKGL